MLVRGAMRTQKLLLFDDAILPLNGQIPVIVFALRNNRVAERHQAIVVASKHVSWNALPAWSFMAFVANNRLLGTKHRPRFFELNRTLCLTPSER